MKETLPATVPDTDFNPKKRRQVSFRKAFVSKTFPALCLLVLVPLFVTFFGGSIEIANITPALDSRFQTIAPPTTSTEVNSGYLPIIKERPAAVHDCPTVLVVPFDNSGSLATWLGLHALLSHVPATCPQIPVRVYIHSSLVDQMQHAVATWQLPGQPRVAVHPFARFAEHGQSLDSAVNVVTTPGGNRGSVIICQSKQPVPEVNLLPGWATERAVRAFQAHDADVALSEPRSDSDSDPVAGRAFQNRTTVFAFPQGSSLAADSCVSVSGPEDIVRCLEDSLRLVRDEDSDRVTLTVSSTCSDRTCRDKLLSSAMERNPKCNLVRPEKRPSAADGHNQTECGWLDEHSALRHTLLPFALTYDISSLRTANVSYSTQMTVDRLDRLEEGARRWGGPMSVAVYTTLDEAFSLADIFRSSAVMQGRRNVMYHVVGRCGPIYPVNAMRNAATRYAVTPYVLLVDVDVVPTKDMYEALEGATVSLALNHKELLVVPVVEYPRKRSNGLTHRNPPMTKDELRPLFLNNSIIAFEEEISQTAYKPMDIGRYLNSTEDYVVDYAVYYEPYMVLDRLKTPLFDEAFLGYGFDKSSLHAKLHVEGYRFKVLSSCGFLFHIENPKVVHVTTWRPNKTENYCNFVRFKMLFKNTTAWVKPKSPAGKTGVAKPTKNKEALHGS